VNSKAYTESLEKQNEQLIELLSEARAFIAWKERQRLHFYYVMLHETDEESQRRFIVRSHMTRMLKSIKENGIDFLLMAMFPKKHIRTFMLTLVALPYHNHDEFDGMSAKTTNIKIMYELHR
jgi:hypothetical protein